MGKDFRLVEFMLCSKVCGIVSGIMCFLRSQLYDAEYYEVSIEELREFNEYWVRNYLSRIEYTPETFDCDDFAMLYKALAVMHTGKNSFFVAVGKLYGRDGKFLGYHAWVAALTDAGVKFIEPQTGDIFGAGCKAESSDGYQYGLMWVIG